MNRRSRRLIVSGSACKPGGAAYRRRTPHAGGLAGLRVEVIGAFATSARVPGANDARGDVDALSFKLTRQLGRIAAALLPPLLETSLVGIEDRGRFGYRGGWRRRTTATFTITSPSMTVDQASAWSGRFRLAPLPCALLAAHRAGSPPGRLAQRAQGASRSPSRRPRTGRAAPRQGTLGSPPYPARRFLLFYSPQTAAAYRP